MTAVIVTATATASVNVRGSVSVRGSVIATETQGIEIVDADARVLQTIAAPVVMMKTPMHRAEAAATASAKTAILGATAAAIENGIVTGAGAGEMTTIDAIAVSATCSMTAAGVIETMRESATGGAASHLRIRSASLHLTLPMSCPFWSGSGV